MKETAGKFQKLWSKTLNSIVEECMKPDVNKTKTLDLEREALLQCRLSLLKQELDCLKGMIATCELILDEFLEKEFK